MSRRRPRAQTRLFFLIASGLAVCAGTPTPEQEDSLEEILEQLQEAMDEVIESDEDDHAISALVLRVHVEGLLVGMERAEIEKALGTISRCGDAAWCMQVGLGPDDGYYEVGRLPEGWNGGVPMLLIGFDEEDRCERSAYLHGQ